LELNMSETSWVSLLVFGNSDILYFSAFGEK